MPTYEYLCSECHREFELFGRPIDQRDQTACPHCGGVQVSRKLSLFAAHAGAAASVRSGPAATCPRCTDGVCQFGE